MSTVARELAAGRLRGVRIRGAVRIDEDELVAYVRGRGGKPAQEPITPGQSSALHAKASELDKLEGHERGQTKARALELASEYFGRSISSASELTRAEAVWVLDLLESWRSVGMPA